jgi:hypothetical protein
MIMQSGPQFQVAPTWLGLIVILAAGLAFLAFIAVLTAVLAAGKPFVPMQRIKALAAMLVLIVPALAVVGLVGWFWATPATGHREGHSARRDPAEMRAEVGPTRSVARRRPSRTTAASADASVEGHSATIVRTGSAKMPRAISTNDDGSTKSAIIAEAEDSSSDRNGPAEGTVAPSVSGKSAVQPERADDVAVEITDDDEAPVPKARLSAPPLTGVLRVRGTASAPPEWAETKSVLGDNGVLVALSSGRFATIGEAEEDLTAKAVAHVKDFYKQECPLRGDWTVPVSVIEQNALNAIVGEMFDKDFGNGMTGMMYRAHLRLELNPALRKALHSSWNEQIVGHRLMELGGVLGLATLILATFAGYFRLDDWTGGKYRRRLKLAAASLFAAGSLVTSVCVLLA